MKNNNDSLDVCAGNAFSKPLQAIRKTDLSTFVWDLMINLMSYELCLISYLMSYVQEGRQDTQDIKWWEDRTSIGQKRSRPEVVLCTKREQIISIVDFATTLPILSWNYANWRRPWDRHRRPRHKRPLCAPDNVSWPLPIRLAAALRWTNYCRSSVTRVFCFV